MGLKLQEFKRYLYENEKSSSTIEKYMRELIKLQQYADGKPLTKELLISYRDQQLGRFQSGTINGKLSAINSYLAFSDMGEYRLKYLKVQRTAFVEECRELSTKEYKRLLEAAKRKKDFRIYYIILTICSTGIRVSELKYITVKAVKTGRAQIRMKGKTRVILLPKELVKKLNCYLRRQNITEGVVFCTRNGNPVDRSNICHDMKKLCEEAGVEEQKVFPHNLRHLFARSFYAVEKNLALLADILGHSSIETTRIYVAASVRVHEHILRKMQLII